MTPVEKGGGADILSFMLVPKTDSYKMLRGKSNSDYHTDIYRETFEKLVNDNCTEIF